MKSKETAAERGYEIEPFYKRWWDDISSWFVKKATEAKTNFLSYIKSKETHKKWKRIAIFVGIIILIVVSFRVKAFFNLWPYDEGSYLIVSVERDNLTDYSGALGYSRLTTFFKNASTRMEDKVRIVHSEQGYNVIEDLEYDGRKLTLTIDNRKNKTLPKSERVKETFEYESCKSVYTSEPAEKFMLIDAEGKSYLLASRSMK